MSGKDIVDFTIKGKVGVAVIGALLSALLGVAGMSVKISNLSCDNEKQAQRIEGLEKNCQIISVALARIEANTENIKEKISEHVRQSEVRK
jgi:hypothetical protein